MSAAEAAEAPARRNEILDLVVTVGTGLAIAIALKIVLFQPYEIPSSSMEPGLRTGDYVIVSKGSYGWSRASIPFNPPLPGGRLFARQPKRGDVVVFRLPRDPQQVYVKRLIGLPGDRIRVVGGEVFVNGVPIPRRPVPGLIEDPEAPGRAVTQVAETKPDGKSYVTFDAGPGHEGDDTDEYVVPPGRYFFMGDNRDNSLDSRWPQAVGVGFVPFENLIGKAEVVLISWRPDVSVRKPWTWLELRPSRFFHRVV